MGESDGELLARYLRERSDEAFGLIVSRYADLVYNAALRQTGDRELSQDVAQAAFIVLARRAGSAPANHLPGWLLKTVRFCAKDALRKQIRRVHHEQEAANMRPIISPPHDAAEAEISVQLDEAMARLAARDNTAIALRFLQNKPMADVAAAMGLSVDAAQKIVTRALVKLRKALSHEGVVLPSTVVLVALLEKLPCHAAPPILGQGAATLSIAKGVINMMYWTKVKVVAIALVVFLTGGAGVVVLTQTLADSQQATPTLPAATAVARQVPQERPLLEFVGCRIKQDIDLNLATPAKPPRMISVIQQEYPVLHWNGDPSASAYKLSIAPASDPTAVNTMQIDKQAESQSLQKVFPELGDYILTLSALDASGALTGQASAHVVVKPLPYTQAMLNDLQPDGSIKFSSVIQSINRENQVMGKGSFTNSNFVQVDSMTDDEGNPIAMNISENGDHFQYRYKLNKPVRPGEALLIGSSGSMTGLIRKEPNGLCTYSMRHFPGSNLPTRRIEMYMLPAGAKLVSVMPAGLKTRTVEGRVQVLLDVIIPVGGSNSVIIRYRLP